MAVDQADRYVTEVRQHLSRIATLLTDPGETPDAAKLMIRNEASRLYFRAKQEADSLPLHPDLGTPRPTLSELVARRLEGDIRAGIYKPLRGFPAAPRLMLEQAITLHDAQRVLYQLVNRGLVVAIQRSDDEPPKYFVTAAEHWHREGKDADQ